MAEPNSHSIIRNIVASMGSEKYPGVYIWACDEDSAGETVSDIIAKCQEGAFHPEVAIKLISHLMVSVFEKFEET